MKEDVKNVGDFIFPDVKDSFKYEAIGFILSVCTGMVAFFFFYGMFFDRRNYYNRKYLYDYLMINELPSPKEFSGRKQFKIGNAEITHHGTKWYVYEGSNLKICSFITDPIDRKRYKYINKRLLEKK